MVLITLLVLQAAFAFVCASFLIYRFTVNGSRRHNTLLAVLGIQVVGAVAATFVSGQSSAAAGAAVGALCSVPALFLRHLSTPGRLSVAAWLHLTIVGSIWGLGYVLTLDVSTTTRTLMLVGLPLMAVTAPIGVLSMIPQWEVLWRTDWRRPRAAARSTGDAPKVSLHVPICSEPPEVVLQTLSALAALDYSNFEVLVIDNNTKDERLWRPVERWCADDERFKFFHLESWPGAKAGALNFALTQTASDASIIGLIDSDYQARPTFLSALVGHFEDPQLGFVQTPHDYRDWEHSLYQRMCYWEYRYFFGVTLPSWNERGAAITVGTMALIRRQALEDAGGWSEWCLTEDSELAPRIHACGYTSVYVQETFGRGLIPETFAGYAKQRRRWTYGPIQELRAHLPMLLPRRFAERTALTPTQKMWHLQHDVDPLFAGLGLLMFPLGLVVTISMLLNGERPEIPRLIWVSGISAGLASLALGSFVQMRALRCSFTDLLCAGVAKSALSYSIASSALRAIFRVPLAWQRTNKFKANAQGLGRVVASARVELFLGVVLLVTGLTLLLGADAHGLMLLLLVGLTGQGVSYLAAPILAAIAEWELSRSARAEREFASMPDPEEAAG